MGQYLYGQGKLYVAKRDANGMPKKLRWFGDTSEAKLSLKTDTLNHKESFTGQRATALKLTTGKEASFEFTLMELSKENLAMELYGKVTGIASGSITGEVAPLALVAGDR